MNAHSVVIALGVLFALGWAYTGRHRLHRWFHVRRVSRQLKRDNHHVAARLAKDWIPPLGQTKDEFERARENLMRRYPATKRE